MWEMIIVQPLYNYVYKMSAKFRQISLLELYHNILQLPSMVW